MPIALAIYMTALALFGSGLVQVDTKNHALVLHKEVIHQGKAEYKVNQ